MQKPMICVPIVASTENEIEKEAKRCNDLQIDVVEWRIDFFHELANTEKVVSLAKKLKALLQPKLLVTWRTEAEGGEKVPSEISYLQTLLALIQNQTCDCIDFEMERPDEERIAVLQAAKEAKIATIGSYHNFLSTPSQNELEERLVKMKEEGFSIAKIAVMPQSKEDVDTLLMATLQMKERNPDYEVITMSMGELGKKSRLYGWLYGSSLTFASAGKASAPGQVAVETVKKAISIGDGGKKHIILAGFMGTGKTTISKELHELSGKVEYDADAMIVQQENRSIKDIFEQDGEEYFRDVESQLIDQLAEMEPGILSCGGGMVLRDLNIRKLKEIGTIMLLTAKPETVLSRVQGNDSRPVLNGNMNIEFISNLMSKRQPMYDQAADYVVETDGKTANAIAKEILCYFQQKSS